VQQKTTKTDSLVPCIEVIQGQIMGWNVIWIGWGERVSYLEWPKTQDCTDLDADNTYEGNDQEKGKSWGSSETQ